MQRFLMPSIVREIKDPPPRGERVHGFQSILCNVIYRAIKQNRLRTAPNAHVRLRVCLDCVFVCVSVKARGRD